MTGNAPRSARIESVDLMRGTSAYLTLERMSKTQLSRFLLSRGLWLTRWYAQVKRTHTNWWLSYL